MTAEPFPDVTLVITSCGRYDLLRRTIASMDPWLARFPNRILVEDGPGEEAELAPLRAEGFEVLVNGRRRGQHASIDRAYAEVRTPFILHCEDDWEFFREPDIATAAAILEAGINGYRRISCVCFCDNTNTPGGARFQDAFREVVINGSRYNYSFEQKRATNSFVFSPCLLLHDLTRVTGPYTDFTSEGQIAKTLHCRGYITVRELPGVVRHIGFDRRIPPAKSTAIMRGKSLLKRAARRSVRSIRLSLFASKAQEASRSCAMPEDEPMHSEKRRMRITPLENPQQPVQPQADKKTLKAIEEAVAVRRGLAEAQSDASRPNLAESLQDLSNCLAGLGGRREEALEAIEESVAVRRQLAETRPDAFRPDLASSLHDLSIRLSALGREKEALEASGEAVAIRRGLAEVQPDAFRPDLARSLDLLAYCRFGFRGWEEVLAAAREAVAAWREPAEAQPDAFGLNLARSLHNLGGCLFRLGRDKESGEAFGEAVAVLRSLATARPDAFLPDLTRSLHYLGVCRRRLGRGEEERKIVEEIATICSGNS